MNEMIRLENVVKIAPDGRRAVGGITLTVQEGEHVQVGGAAGSGKTTLMRLIAGMETPSAGCVFVTGKAVHEMDEDAAAAFRRRTMGICLRKAALLGCLPVWENVALPLALRGVSSAKRKAAAMVQLRALGIAYAAHASPTLLTACEAQLSSIARALAGKPKLLLLDEIAADLSEKDAQHIIGVLSSLQQFQDATTIAFAQSARSALFPRYLELDQGTIREE